MKENVVHITVGCIFDVYVQGLISKETYDACIESYKEYQQAKQGIVHNEPELTPAQYHPGTHVKLAEPIEFVHAPADGKSREGCAVHGPSVDIQFLKDHRGDKWREGIVGKGSISKESVDAIINDIVEQIKVWRDNNLPKHTIDGIDYDELNQLVSILHDYRFMSASMFRDLTKVLQQNKELHECYKWYAEQDMFIRNKY